MTLYADGLNEPRNPGGYACYGWLALDENGRRIAEGQGCLGHGPGTTNNIAEYRAAIEALKWAASQGIMGVDLLADSKLVVNQANGAWACRAPHLFDLLVELRTLMAQTNAKLRWIPREENEEADRLSRKAYAAARKGVRV
ncbi:MAG: hypothetical protein A2139_14240 [Desulfobacca sp. RBG_16_60_12]|nr:MAG: hypothetical protein A2139_14240 [Desulfobacca sp. RBG_16_60_12]